MMKPLAIALSGVWGVVGWGGDGGGDITNVPCKVLGIITLCNANKN
jgi:hypothetical protein